MLLQLLDLCNLHFDHLFCPFQIGLNCKPEQQLFRQEHSQVLLRFLLCSHAVFDIFSEPLLKTKLPLEQSE